MNLETTRKLPKISKTNIEVYKPKYNYGVELLLNEFKNFRSSESVIPAANLQVQLNKIKFNENEYEIDIPLIGFCIETSAHAFFNSCRQNDNNELINVYINDEANGKHRQKIASIIFSIESIDIYVSVTCYNYGARINSFTNLHQFSIIENDGTKNIIHNEGVKYSIYSYNDNNERTNIEEFMGYKSYNLKGNLMLKKMILSSYATNING